jgi:hypothetical protein
VHQTAYTADLDLAAVSTRDGLSVMLRTVHVRADRPSFRALEVSTRHSTTPLSKTVVSEMLRGVRFPRKSVMEAFLRACGVPDDDLMPWQRAWERIAEAELGLAAADVGEIDADTIGIERRPAKVGQLDVESGRPRTPLSAMQLRLTTVRPQADDLAAKHPQARDSLNRALQGRYELRSRLGSGGMGSVWLAEDLLLGRDVALKELGHHFAGGDSDERWARALVEAKAMARVIHPALVPIHDAFMADEVAWIVMGYIKGRSLDAIIRVQPLDEQTAASIGLPILGALRAVHAAQVMHRDVKPANILVSDNDSVFLVDFGIAKIGGEEQLTRTGQLLGTPMFLAPELIQGEPPGPASDLWSLGVTLFCALEGYSPFRRDDVQATLVAILRDDPPCPTNEGKLAAAITRLLHKDPAQRMGAQELADVLQGILRDPLARLVM